MIKLVSSVLETVLSETVFGPFPSFVSHRVAHPKESSCGFTVRAEIITELILKRAGSVIFKTFFLELIAFRPIPVICPARGVKPENYWKR